MITGFKPGTLYKLSPKHVLYGSELRKLSQRVPHDLIFLCTNIMYCPIVDGAPVFNYTPQKVHLLIDVDTGDLWETDPNTQGYEEYLQ